MILTRLTSMRRRHFITLIGAAATAWPLAVRAQQAGKVRRIGFLAGGSRPISVDFNPYSAFVRGMRELGYVEGRDFIVEWRFAEGRAELFPDLAAELVRLNPDVIVLGTQVAVPAVKRATETIPIVMGIATDPVGQGFVASLAHPGGNVTGLASSLEEIVPKQLELLAMAVPSASRIGFLCNATNPSHIQRLAAAQKAGDERGRVIVSAQVQNAHDFASAFTSLSNERINAIMVPADALFFSHRQRIAELAISMRLPTMCAQREYVEAGGLMGYGESLADFYRRAAFYVDKIFKGARPVDLPIQHPTRFFLVINRKTAEALGLAIPLQLLVAADEVIE
jgi:putative ABC transport system substrate-binding protein